MKRKTKAILLLSAFTASLGLGTSEVRATDGALNSTKAEESNYCHMHFPAIDERTLSWPEPVLKDPSSGDIIHFYGACDYDPHGREAVQTRSVICSVDFGGEYNN